MTVDQVLEILKSNANPEQLEGMARFGIQTDQRLGLSIYDLRRIAKGIPPDHQLALDLWKSDLADARILASMVDVPEEATEYQLEEWVKDFNSWDICDQVCDNLFQHTRFAWDKVRAWSTREEEFVKRAAYALLSCLAWHDKQASDRQFLDVFPIIRAGADDGRNFVKKAVNWALRNIGKRNQALNQAAIQLAQELLAMDDKTARWIARDALRELQSEKIQQRVAGK